MPIFVCEFNKNYEIFLAEVYEYVVSNFARDFNLSSLNKIEIEESLPGLSDGRMIDPNNILLSKRLYDLLPILDIASLYGNDDFDSIVGALCHELCHINEQSVMPSIHEICYNEIKDINYCVALFWIEYIVETKTNAKITRNKSNFCKDVALCNWNIIKFNYEDADTSNYFYLIKILSYVLANCQMPTYSNTIKNTTVKNMVIELYDAISQIKGLYPFDSINNLDEIKRIFLSYKKQFAV